jgi:hypothetical protein
MASIRSAALSFLLIASATAVHAESAAGVRWTPPAGWTSEGARPMRAATYAVAAAAGDTMDAECGVYFFGAGQGGSVDANLERWAGQFTGAGGAPAKPQIAKRLVHGVPVTTIDVSGSYSGLGGPVASGVHTVAGYRLLGAIVQGPGGNIFVKFTGPAKTVGGNQQKFEQLLASFQPDK